MKIMMAMDAVTNSFFLLMVSGSVKTRAKQIAPRRPPYAKPNWSLKVNWMVLKGLMIWVSTRMPAGQRRRLSSGPRRVVDGRVKPLTDSPPHEGEQQREHDVAPVPLVLGRYGNDTQEEEDDGLGDGAQHLDHVADGGAGSLRHVLLHVVLHGDGAGDDAAGRGMSHSSGPAHRHGLVRDQLASECYLLQHVSG